MRWLRITRSRAINRELEWRSSRRKQRGGIAVFLFITASAVFAQLGDLPNDASQKRPNPLPPPPPVRSAAEQLGTFQLPPGFQIELVADESLVHDPVAVAFDLEGNLWVAEMSGLNRDIVTFLPELANGLKELPPGKIVKLSSSRRDGRFDRRMVFLDGLDAPRSIGLLRDGVLVADPPYLWFARDRDGDGRSDEREVVSNSYGRRGEYASSANGLLWGRDNVIRSISHDEDLRRRERKWERIPVPRRGQWGLAQDDFGRLFYTRNSDHLRADLFSPHYGSTTAHVSPWPWVNVQVAADQTVWPRHPTPSANRGYRPPTPGETTGGLRADGSLLELSAAGGTTLYRGSNFPAEFYNNAFIPDSIGNLVKRSLLLEAEGRITVVNAYQGREFLISTDERFRPVAVANAPDGSLIVVDLYRGLIESYNFISSSLRDQVLSRRLNDPFQGMGRIWRVTYKGGPVETRPPALKDATAETLVQLLSHPNAWWRDTAQQALVERGDRSVVPALENLARRAETGVTRAYALWALDGLDAITPTLAGHALLDTVPAVRSAAIRLHERWLGDGAEADAAFRRLEPLVRDPASEVVVQLALSLGAAKTSERFAPMAAMLEHAGAHPFIPHAIASALGGSELEFLDFLAPRLSAAHPPPEFADVITILSEGLVKSGNASRLAGLIQRASDTGSLPPWARLAALTGLEAAGKSAVRRGLASEQWLRADALSPLLASADPQVQVRANRLSQAIKKLDTAEIARQAKQGPLTADDRLLVERGKTMYLVCAGCHQADGRGLPGVAPSLPDSPWVVGKPDALVRILINGKTGTPGYPGGMPGITAYNDAHISAVVSYVRNSWGLTAGAVPATTVARIREENLGRDTAWTDSELQKFK